jgi:hypothetical protein
VTGTIAFPAVYKRARGARPWRSASSAVGSWRSAGCAGALVAAFLLTAGCSTDVSLGAPAAKEDDKLQTGSVASPPATGEQPLPPEADLAFARRAAVEVLARGGRDTSQPWENPGSGARGTITPLASAYRVEGALCRDFLASYVKEGTESWMQGEACRGVRGRWEVRRLKPWRQA